MHFKDFEKQKTCCKRCLFGIHFETGGMASIERSASSLKIQAL